MEVRLLDSTLQLRDLGGQWHRTMNRSRAGPTIPGQTLQLGSFKVPPGTIQDWVLRLGSSEQQGHQLIIPTDGSLTIGRNPESDICINLPQVSWNHARIESKDDRWFLVDLGSSNGTWVNGSRIKRTRVTREDSITLGSVPLELGRRSTTAISGRGPTRCHLHHPPADQGPRRR